MYLSVINYQPKIVINRSSSQNCNTKFCANNKAVEKSCGLTHPALPLMYNNLYSNSIINFMGKTSKDSSKGTKKQNNKISEIINSEQKSPEPIHHPDFYELSKNWDILASSYFRRGGFYGSPCDEFVDTINSLKNFFNPDALQQIKENKIKLLVGGVGRSQEPYSLLATIKNLIGEEDIDNVLDMYTVDLQGKPGERDIFEQSFYDCIDEPVFARTSFIADDGTKYGLARYKKYRVSDDLFEYLLNTYNSEKSKWQTRIQDELKEYPDEKFDIISINNTLGYIYNPDERKDSVQNIYRTLKPNGIFISDNRLDVYNEIFTPENSNEIYPGIFQKNSL